MSFAQPPREVTAFIDFSDPLSYIVSTQLEGWCSDGSMTVRWVPISSALASADEDHRRNVALSLAAMFRYPLFPRGYVNSMPAQRASVLAQKRATISQFVMRVFQFWFATDLPPYSDILFDRLAVDCEIPQMELSAALASAHHWTSEDVSRAAQHAQTIGVHSTPVLIAPDGTKIEVHRLNAEHPLEDLVEELSRCGLASYVRTPAARCYLPSNTDQPERFCRWCTCGKTTS